MNVSAQLYDFIFAARSNDEEDSALIDAAKKAGNVYFGLAFELLKERKLKLNQSKGTKELLYLNKTKWQVAVKKDPTAFYVGANPLITFPALASASHGLGYLSLKFDPDGVFRRLPLLVRYRGAYYPSFAFRAICDYLKVSPENIVIKPGKNITLKEAKRNRNTTTNDIVIPIDRYGNMLINFIGPWERMKHYNFADILLASEDRDEMEMWQEELSGKIVVVSEVFTGSTDVGPVPTDNNFPLPGLHANVIHTILTESFLRELSDNEMIFIELLLLLTVLILSLRFSSISFSLSTLGVGGSYVCIAALFFFYGHLIFHILRPLLMATFALISILAFRYINEEKQKEVLRRTFEAYFPPLIVKKIMANPKMIASRGQQKELTILFSDIENFSSYSAAMTPDHIQRLLSEYFEKMTEIVFKYNGTVDKFIGDGLMVFFGDPDTQPDHALRCVQAAIEMQMKVREIKTQWKKRGYMLIKIRIGINTGTVVVGNMGSARRLSYTVAGSAVNLAKRLESNAPPGGILISQRTYDMVEEHVHTRPFGQIQVKGFDKSISTYEVPVDTKPT